MLFYVTFCTPDFCGFLNILLVDLCVFKCNAIFILQWSYKLHKRFSITLQLYSSIDFLYPPPPRKHSQTSLSANRICICIRFRSSRICFILLNYIRRRNTFLLGGQSFWHTTKMLFVWVFMYLIRIRLITQLPWVTSSYNWKFTGTCIAKTDRKHIRNCFNWIFKIILFPRIPTS